MVIRKLSIGPDVKSSMNFIVGNSIINDSFTVMDIIEKDEWFDIYIENDSQEVLKWKTVSKNMPHVIEYNINI